MSKFICIICGQRKFGQLRSYLLHLRIRHAHDANFRAVCGISECKSEYNKYASLYKHIYRIHKVFVDNSLNEHNNEQSADPLPGASDDDDMEVEDI